MVDAIKAHERESRALAQSVPSRFDPGLPAQNRWQSECGVRHSTTTCLTSKVLLGLPVEIYGATDKRKEVIK